MKTINDIKEDMSVLYDEFYDGKIERNTASELANIAGKYLKAEQLALAREIFLASLGRRTQSIELPQAQAVLRDE